jgi:hypothetical protein
MFLPKRFSINLSIKRFLTGWLPGCVLALLAATAHAQISTLGVEAGFVANEGLITNGELVTNVLRIKNNTGAEISFRINTDYPPSWKQLSRPGAGYTVAAGDSLFLPFRFIPSGDLTGNNRFMISAFLIGTDDQQLATGLFWAFTRKRTSWSVSSEAGTRVYFKNGSNTADFDISLLNTGTERQQIVLSLNNMSLFSEITDSAGNSNYRQPYNLLLDPYQDTTFRFKFRYTQGKRNAARIDIENYRPENLNEEKVFNLLVNTEEPSFGQQGTFEAGQRITFKKLSDDKQAASNGYSRMPLIVDYNVANLMDNISFSTLNVRGVAQLSFNEQLVYNFQGSAVSNHFEEFLTNNNYYLGYFYARGNVQLGYINGGLMGIQSFGQGVRSSYMLTPRHTLTGFYIYKKDRFGQEMLNSYGMAYDVKYFRQNKARVEVGRSNNEITGVSTTAVTGRVNYNFLKFHSLNLSLSNTFNDINTPGTQRRQTYGYFAMGTYNGNFWKNRLNENHGFGYSSNDYANANLERFFYNHRFRLIFNDRWSTTMVNNYNSTYSKFYLNAEVTSLTSQLAFNRAFRARSIQPFLTYNVFQQVLVSYDMKGAGFNYNQFNPRTGTRFSTTVEAGVNTPRNMPGAEPTTYLQWNMLLFYKTLTANARYIAGTYGYVPPSGSIAGSSSQQLFVSSLQHQYVFSNTKLMLQTNVNYYYNNVFRQHSITLFPDLYYFTTDGWRFRLGINYNLISNIALGNNYASQQQALISEDQSRITTQNTFVSVGVRKEFSLPIPLRRTQYCDINFVAFFDVNGNGLRDRNEHAIENVIIRLGDDEIITNPEGEARLRNAPMFRRPLVAFPLEPIEGWFPNQDDTALILRNKAINIPFVKGVKIKGKVSIDREAISADADETFDLSRIRITASGQRTFNVLTDFNGNFEFYLPYGKYIITMDEAVLGGRFRIARNNYDVEASKESDGMVISFLIIEKKRKIIKKTFPAAPEK